MRKRKWKKGLAAATAAAVLLTLPGIENLINSRYVHAGDWSDGSSFTEEELFVGENADEPGQAPQEQQETTEEPPLDMEEITEEEPPQEPEVQEPSGEESFVDGEDTDPSGTEEENSEELFIDSTEEETEASGIQVTMTRETADTETVQILHIQAEDLREEAAEPSTVTVHFRDTDSETPVTDVEMVQGITVEETLAAAEAQKEESSWSTLLPGAVTSPSGIEDLTVEKIQETGTDEEGNPFVIEEYLQFVLPAGASADFYGGFIYETEEQNFDKQVLAEASVLQEMDGEQPGHEIILNDGDLLFDDNAESSEDNRTPASVLAGVASVMLTWRGRTSNNDSYAVYFAKPEDWPESDKIYFNAHWGEQPNDKWIKKPMQDTSQTYGENQRKVYKVELSGTECPYKGFATMQFQRWDQNGGFQKEIVAFYKWTSEDVFKNKLYDSATNQWVEYTPVDPDDHTAFAGKTIYFENKDAEKNLDRVTAEFYEKNTDGVLQLIESLEMKKVENRSGVFSVIIPEAPCSYIVFKDSEGKILGDEKSNFYGQGTEEENVESFLYNEKNKNSYKYAGKPEDSTWGALGEKTVYFDAALSKLSYRETVDKGKPMPYEKEGSTIYCYATNADGQNGMAFPMQKLPEHTRNGNTWKDVYSVDLPEGYTRIRFTAWKDPKNEDVALNGDGTEMMEIPSDLVNPCFYADTSDSVIYEGGNRDGYWDEVYHIRNAEAKKGKDVVDIKPSDFKRDLNTFYADSVFYDYYTDYELNGNNRKMYPGNNGASQRNWVTFRQFNQALSDYYSSGKISIPIYTGHFQPDPWPFAFSQIAGTLNLYGWDSYQSFISTNNSNFDVNGNGGQYDAAAQGLVSNNLQNGTLMTAGGTLAEPHFNEAFLQGANSKNTVLGEVYHNVKFPFTKKDVNGNGVEYWYFDSKDTTLAMRQDLSSGEYYLDEVGNQPWSQNVNSSGTPDGKDGVSTQYGFFPFNEGTDPCSGKNYNYGFGTRLDIPFSLTENGTVLDENGNEVPIEFKFSGDDDVWVFIDGELALDVGGAHGRATGTLNFATMKATVSKVKASAGSSVGGADVTSDFSLKGKKTAKHTLTMFYMERGMWESNMQVMFNFPDENQLQIKKEVNTERVHPLFKDLFKDTSLFTFDIKNQATHYGTKEAQTEDTQTKQPFEVTSCDSSVTGNTCEMVNKGEFSGSVHWKAKMDDSAGQWRDRRKGILSAENAVDISKMKYLDFTFYYQYGDNPSLNNMYLQLVDTEGKIKNTSDFLSGKTYGTVKMAGNQWITVRLDLSKMQEQEGFNHQVKSIKFGYNYSRDFYLKDFVFRPLKEAPVKAGFVTKQYDIPDYGSAESGSLEVPDGAVYTSSKSEGEAYQIDETGKFVLEDQETITFADQFRRGSYLLLQEEPHGDLYSTTWTVFDNGVPVTSMTDGNVIDNGTISNLQNVPGYSINDGRTENCLGGNDSEGHSYQDGNNYQGKRPEEPVFVFRSYAEPDNLTATTRLKVVFRNTINTGSLTICKKKAYETDNLSETYTFKVTFRNVGGAALEEAPITQEIKLRADEDYRIEGIPLGTDFLVEEIKPEDGSSLESITGSDSVIVDMEQGSVKGTVTKENQEVNLIFKNTKKPLTDVSVEKIWKDQNGSSLTEGLPTEIHVQLQRSRDGSSWETVESYKNIKLEPQWDYNEKGELVLLWKKTIPGLDQKVDYTVENSPDWQYRFVELNADGQPVENGKITTVDGKNFTVTYEQELYKTTICNTYVPPKTSLRLKKSDASAPDKLLGGVAFKLEKMKETDGKWEVDNEFPPITGETVNDSNSPEYGYLVFKDLPDGRYRLTETKAADGYSLLKEPVDIIIDRSGKSYVGNQEIEIKDNTLEFTVLNHKKFQIPTTGSWSRYIMILSGLVAAGTFTILYLLQKRRKGE